MKVAGRIAERKVLLNLAKPGAAFFEAGQGALGVEHMREMQESLRQGMRTDEAGAAIMRGISAGDFWVTTHPEMLQWLSGMRAEQIGKLKKPALGEMGN